MYPEVTLTDLEWADAIIFSVPTRFGNMPAQVKAIFRYNWWTMVPWKTC